MSEEGEGKTDLLPIENFSVAYSLELVVSLDSLGKSKVKKLHNERHPRRLLKMIHVKQKQMCFMLRKLQNAPAGVFQCLLPLLPADCYLLLIHRSQHLSHLLHGGSGGRNEIRNARRIRKVQNNIHVFSVNKL